MSDIVERAFVRTEDGLVHYRSAGPITGAPLVLLHASPGSSRGLEALIEALHHADPERWILAPDTLGNGDSAPPSAEAPDIAWFAGSLVRLIDRLGIAHATLYGTHTGARIACEAAILAPERIGRIVLDGIGDYAPEMRALLLRDYAPEMQPDEYGRHLIWAFNFVRDQALHYPYFLRDPEHRLMTRAVPEAEEMHIRTLEVLKGLTSYHKAYRAAFAYPATQRLPLVPCPALFLDSRAELPVLKAKVRAFADSVPDAAITEVDPEPGSKAAAILDFLR